MVCFEIIFQSPQTIYFVGIPGPLTIGACGAIKVACFASLQVENKAELLPIPIVK